MGLPVIQDVGRAKLDGATGTIGRMTHATRDALSGAEKSRKNIETGVAGPSCKKRRHGWLHA
jgi:hypothetical protein